MPGTLCSVSDVVGAKREINLSNANFFIAGRGSSSLSETLEREKFKISFPEGRSDVNLDSLHIKGAHVNRVRWVFCFVRKHSALLTSFQLVRISSLVCLCLC